MNDGSNIGFDQLLEEAARVILREQNNDGMWHYASPAQIVTTSFVLVAEYFMGTLSDADAKDGRAWLCSQQQDDGGFLPYTSAHETTVNATANAYAALYACGAHGDDDPHLLRARRYLQRDRAIDSLDLGAQLALCMAGADASTSLPQLHTALLGLPGMYAAAGKRLSAAALLYLMCVGAITTSVGSAGRSVTGMGLKWVERQRLNELIGELQNPDGSIFSLPLMTALAAASLYALGHNDARLRAARAYLDANKRRTEQGMYIDALHAELWNTAWSLRTLLASGLQPEHPQIVAAKGALLDAQIRAPSLSIYQPDRSAQLCGGFAFGRENSKQPDTDDTAAALMALAALQRGGDEDPRIDAAISDASAWMLDMQNTDGGWGAFAHGLPGKPSGPIDVRAHLSLPSTLSEKLTMATSPPLLFGDPSTEDVTGRVLWALGDLGYDMSSAVIRRAVGFLRGQQTPTGAWWGMWMVCYLPSTACVLAGLGAVGYDMQQPWVQRATGWIKARQNLDGGWGELPHAFDDPRNAGVGPSMPALTGLVLVGLSYVSSPCPLTKRGAAYLRRQRNTKGSWDDDAWLQVLMLPEGYYRLDCHPRCFPMLALTLATQRERGDRGDAQVVTLLDDARHIGDPKLEASMEGTCPTDQHALLRECLRASASRPANASASSVRSVLSALSSVPEWLDLEKIALAQRAFDRHLYAWTAGLFFGALPTSYAFAEGANVLMATGRLQADVERRIRTTSSFIFTLMRKGAFATDGPAFAELRAVRLGHAAVRHELEHRQRWTKRGTGRALHMEHMAATLLCFSLINLTCIEKMGIRLSTAERQAIFHLWSVAGWMLGIDKALLPHSEGRAIRLWRVVTRRNFVPNGASRDLTRALLDSMRRLFIPGPMLDNLPSVLIREFVGSQLADRLGVADSAAGRGLFRMGRAVMRRIDGKPVVAHLLQNPHINRSFSKFVFSLQHPGRTGVPDRRSTLDHSRTLRQSSTGEDPSRDDPSPRPPPRAR
ncbi:MAG: oxygenase MpaB family protein [Nannocystaceae bacterium]